MMNGRKKQRVSLALSGDLIEKLDEASEDARRSRSGFVQIILEDYFERVEEKETEPENPRSQSPITA